MARFHEISSPLTLFNQILSLDLVRFSKINGPYMFLLQKTYFFLNFVDDLAKDPLLSVYTFLGRTKFLVYPPFPDQFQ